jgi:hypothetical protein
MVVSIDEVIKQMESIKAISVSDLDKSILQPAYFNQFVVELMQEKTLLVDARMVEMTSPVENIDRTSFSERVLRPMVEGTALLDTRDGTNQNARPEFHQNQLVAVEIGAETGITDKTLRRNIERGNFQQTLLAMFGDRAGIDWEVYALGSSKTNINYPATSVMHVGNGWLDKANDDQRIYGKESITDADDADFDGTDPESMFNQMIQKYPKPYLRNLVRMKIYVGWDLHFAYKEAVAKRVGALADAVLTGQWTPYYMGIEVVYCPAMDDVELVSAHGETAMLVDPNNLIYGIFYQVTIEPWRLPRERKMYFTLCMEVDQHYENENVVVVAYPSTAKPV